MTEGSITTVEDVLQKNYWGWQTDSTGKIAFRVKLPPTEKFPLQGRTCGNIGGVKEVLMPPYLAAEVEGDAIHVDLYEGQGYRVGYDRETDDTSQCVYADSENMPDEWKRPVFNALKEI